MRPAGRQSDTSGMDLRAPARRIPPRSVKLCSCALTPLAAARAAAACAHFNRAFPQNQADLDPNRHDDPINL